MILHNLRFRIVEENYVEKKRKILLRVENFPSSILCDALQNVYALAEHTETTRITAHCIIPNPRLQREHEARISARTTYSSDVTSPLPLSLSRPPPLRRPTCITATLREPWLSLPFDFSFPWFFFFFFLLFVALRFPGSTRRI